MGTDSSASVLPLAVGRERERERLRRRAQQFPLLPRQVLQTYNVNRTPSVPYHFGRGFRIASAWCCGCWLSTRRKRGEVVSGLLSTRSLTNGHCGDGVAPFSWTFCSWVVLRLCVYPWPRLQPWSTPAEPLGLSSSQLQQKPEQRVVHEGICTCHRRCNFLLCRHYTSV